MAMPLALTERVIRAIQRNVELLAVLKIMKPMCWNCLCRNCMYLLYLCYLILSARQTLKKSFHRKKHLLLITIKSICWKHLIWLHFGFLRAYLKIDFLKRRWMNLYYVIYRRTLFCSFVYIKKFFRRYWSWSPINSAIWLRVQKM